MDNKFESTNFIHNEIEEDLKKYPDMKIHTRFPPEPSGYFHIGHVKAIAIDFGTAEKYGGLCNLRMDDTNPLLEKKEYVEAIKDDITWLGFKWHDRVFYGSEYFDQCYDYAVELIKKDLAYVCDLSADEWSAYRGTLTKPGKNSPFRDRSTEENLKLFEEMRAGKFADSVKTLRGKIDMTSPNMHMRDPVFYRIMHVEHSNTGNKWCIYPMYDYAHPIQDAIEGITHSLCSIEFEGNRPLYNWVRDNIGYSEFPKQREFARLNLTYNITSKRVMREMVEKGLVSGWDDPRMPTIAGLRRRGYTPSSLLTFIDKVGVAKAYSVVDTALLEHCIKDELNKSTGRVMAVIDPVKVIITNYPEGQTEMMVTENNPENPEAGTREVPFTKEIFIEKADFMAEPVRKYFRLSPGREVRLKNAYFITCSDYKTDDDGNVTEIYCTYDPASIGGNSPDGRKVKGTLHWVSAEHAVAAEIRQYDRLTHLESPGLVPRGTPVEEIFNPDSLLIFENALVEPSLKTVNPGERFQFIRQGYFCCDLDSADEKIIFNRIVPLRDTWSKIAKKG